MKPLRKSANELPCIPKLNFHHIRLYSRLLSSFADICNQRRVIIVILYTGMLRIFICQNDITVIVLIFIGTKVSSDAVLDFSWVL